MKIISLKCLHIKNNSIEDKEIYCSNSEEEYYDEEFINLFLETFKQ